jgi:hypothetical protein
MRFRVLPALLLSATAALTVAASAPSPPPSFIVHEWGTFTSVAGANGQAVPWQPLTGPPDLPCFVERWALQPKGEIVGTVRMETPVLYFYSPRAVDASVHVDFPQGFVTEWYPHAAVPSPSADGGQISWPLVAVQPGASESFPAESAPSHYYAARQTDADPIRVGAKPEKFLFYRGVGQFQPPVYAVALGDGGAAVTSLHGRALGSVIFLESRRGTSTFSAQPIAGPHAVLPRPSLDDASGPPVAELKRMLIANGLYAREADAMLETWKDSWFEEGARILYVLPRADVDAILPLTISPRPSTLTRVFVGRIELATPATIHDVRAAIESGDRAALAKYGRFLQPFAERAGLTAKIAVGLLPQASAVACR